MRAGGRGAARAAPAALKAAGMRAAGAFALVVAAFLIAAPGAAPAAGEAAGLPGDIPTEIFIRGWLMAEEPQRFPGESLFGHINGGAELFLQYGFRELVVFRFAPQSGAPGKEIVLEVYAMESHRDAFGVFSLKRTGAEPASDRQRALNWVEGGQAAFVLDRLYVNILAAGCTDEDLAGFAAGAEINLAAGRAVPPAGFTGLPERGLMPGTERYIKGAVAASGESPFLAHDFWGFEESGTVAWSARYAPDASRLILLEYGGDAARFRPPAAGLFGEYFPDVIEKDGIVSARADDGRFFLYGRRDARAVFVLGDRDETAAGERLTEALEKSAIVWK